MDMTEYWEVSTDDFIAALVGVGIVDPTTKNMEIRAEAGDKVRIRYDEFEDGVSSITVRPMNGADARGLEELTVKVLRPQTT